MKQSKDVNIVCKGSPSQMRRVLLIFLGMRMLLAFTGKQNFLLSVRRYSIILLNLYG